LDVDWLIEPQVTSDLNQVFLRRLSSAQGRGGVTWNELERQKDNQRHPDQNGERCQHAGEHEPQHASESPTRIYLSSQVR
jgi:hypothetical protein